MVFVPTVGAAKVEIRYLKSGQRVENVLYVGGLTDPSDATTLLDVGNAVRDWVEDTFILTQPSDVLFNSVVVTDASSAIGPSVTVPSVLGLYGTDGSPNPNSVTLAFHKATNGRGRSAQGRLYVPGISTTRIVGVNNVAAVWADDVCARLTILIGVIDALVGIGTPFLAINSLVTGGAPRAAGLLSAITAFVCRDYVVDVQRRRLPGRGL
jgi:hypothetical protein